MQDDEPSPRNAHNRPPELTGVVTLLNDKLGTKETCAEVIDSYEEIMRSIWSFLAQVLGNGGVRALLTRSAQLAVEQVPLLETVQVRERDVDLSAFRTHTVPAPGVDCDTSEVMAALTHLTVVVFQTLSDMTGGTLVEPLLRFLEEA